MTSFLNTIQPLAEPISHDAAVSTVDGSTVTLDLRHDPGGQSRAALHEWLEELVGA